MISTPKAPDPNQTAAAQAGMNRDTAITQMQLNSGTQVNPWGTTSTTQTGTQGFTDSQGRWVETPTFTTTQTLTPEQQTIFNKTQQAEQNLAGIASEQSAKLQSYLNDPFEFKNRDAETWAYDLASPRLLQQQKQNEAALRTTLANKGIREGSAAWNAEMGRLTNANTDQMNQLALTGRQQAFSEAMAQRNQPINEITALMSGSQVSNPAAYNTQGPSASVAGVDYTGLVNQKYQSELQASQAQMGGLFGLASAGIGLFSDRRLKTGARRVGTLDNGLPIYSYRYACGGPAHIGVMADEAAGVVPEAVFMHPSGFAMVDYGAL